jgi:hypothetical protein
MRTSSYCQSALCDLNPGALQGFRSRRKMLASNRVSKSAGGEGLQEPPRLELDPESLSWR